ncbi:MAG: YdeI family protein [Saprospiraceae bacterium]
MKLKNGIKTYYAKSRKGWRNWLQKNADKEKAVWLIIYKKKSEIETVYYPEAVDEALCFGWVDSKINKRDEKSYFQYFSERNPKSNWSRVNKEKVKRLIERQLMTERGYDMIKVAKEKGTWDALNDVENLIVPEDLQQGFNDKPKAFENWNNFPRSAKRAILEWILNAKRNQTREHRIRETVEKAEKNIRANQYRPKK